MDQELIAASLKVFKISDRAYLPNISKDGSYYDLMSAYDVVVPPRGSIEVLTDLHIVVPAGHILRIHARYRMASRNNVIGTSGCLDQRFKGNVGIIMFNNNDQEFRIYRGDRVALMVIQPVVVLPISEIKKKL